MHDLLVTFQIQGGFLLSAQERTGHKTRNDSHGQFSSPWYLPVLKNATRHYRQFVRGANAASQGLDWMTLEECARMTNNAHLTSISCSIRSSVSVS